MQDLFQIDALLTVGLIVAVIAIGGGVRGLYSISVSSRRERTNQTTRYLHLNAHGRKRRQQMKSPAEERKAA